MSILLSRETNLRQSKEFVRKEKYLCFKNLNLTQKAYSSLLIRKLRLILSMITPKNITKQDLPQISLKSTQKQVINNFTITSLLDLPVTFHKKIKSSGYSSQPTSLKYSAK